MLRKIFRLLLAFAILGAVVFFFLVGKIADRKFNKVEEISEIQISDRAKSLHQNILVADLHSDNLLWDRNHTTELGYGHVDIPRLIKGNYALQVFDAVIKTPKNLNYQSNTDETDNIQLVAMANRWPIKTWFSQYNRAVHQSKILKEAAETSAELEFIQSKSDLEYFMKLRRSNSYKVAGILSIEGLHALEGKMENFYGLVDSGYRIMGLVHFFDNEVGGSSAGVDQHGLTDFGKQIIRAMERESIIIDLAHSSPALFNDVITFSKSPVIVSHTGGQGIKDSPRNLTDSQIKQIADRKGLIGIGFWAEAAGGIEPSDIAKSIRYVYDLVGIDIIALGSDFDGAVTTGFTSDQIILLTESLIREGFTDDDIRRIMGGNQIRFLLENLP